MASKQLKTAGGRPKRGSPAQRPGHPYAVSREIMSIPSSLFPPVTSDIRAVLAMLRTERKAPSSAPGATTDEKKTELAMDTIPLARSMFRGRTYRTTLGSNGGLGASSGNINVSIAVNYVSGALEFPSFAAIFDEFFVHSMTINFVPFNHYQTIGTAATYAAPSTGALLVVPLYHGASSYSTFGAMAANVDHKMVDSADRWSFTWHNNENPNSTVTTNPTTSSPLATQAWCLTNAGNAALYSGTVQIRNSLAFSTSIGSNTVGDLVFTFDVSFRARA